MTVRTTRVYRMDPCTAWASCMRVMHGGNTCGNRMEVLLSQHWRMVLVNDLMGLRVRLVSAYCAHAGCRLFLCTRTWWAECHTHDGSDKMDLYKENGCWPLGSFAFTHVGLRPGACGGWVCVGGGGDG